MAKEIFGFRIIDDSEYDSHEHEGYMLYTFQEKTIVPVCDDFLRGFNPWSCDQAIAVLTNNRIKELITFNPEPGKVASAPYELEKEEDFQACQDDGLWYQLRHEEIYEGSKLEKLMKESGIRLKSLSQKEEEDLNRNLKYYQED